MTAPTPSIAEVRARLHELQRHTPGADWAALGDAIRLLDAVRLLLLAERLEDYEQRAGNQYAAGFLSRRERTTLDTLLAPAPTDGGSVQSPNKESP